MLPELPRCGLPARCGLPPLAFPADAGGRFFPPGGGPDFLAGVIRTLLTRGLIEEMGHDEESTAILYGTTSYFLERLGLQSLDDLPALAPYLPEVDVLDEIAEGGRG